MNRFRLRMLRFELFEQSRRRRPVDRLGKIRRDFHRVDVRRSVALLIQYSDSLATAVRLRLLLLASLDPTVRRDAVTVFLEYGRMNRVGKVDGIVFALVFTEFFVFVQKSRLLRRIEFSWNVLRFFVDEIEPMKKFLDTGPGIFHSVRLLDMMGDRLAVEIDR